MPNRVALLRGEIEAAHPGAVIRHRGEAGFAMHLPDGTEEHRYTTGPWHWRQSDGDEWAEIDTDLEDRPHVKWNRGVRSARFDTLVAEDGSRRFIPRRWLPDEYVEFGPLQWKAAVNWTTPALGAAELRGENGARGQGHRLTFDRPTHAFEVGFNGRGCRTNLTLKNASVARPLRWKVTLQGLEWKDGALLSLSDSSAVGFIRPPSWSDSSEYPESKPIPWEYSGGFVTLTPDFTGAQYPITVDPDYHIAAGGDDGMMAIGGSFDSTSVYMYAGNIASKPRHAFFRFAAIAATQAQNCTAATLTVYNLYNYGQIYTDLFGVDEDDHAAPTDSTTWTADHGIHTTATLALDSAGISAGSYTTPDFSDILDEIFARANWQTGYDFGLHWDDGGAASGHAAYPASYENSQYAEPILSLTLAAGGTPATVTPAEAALPLTGVQLVWTANALLVATVAALTLTAPQVTAVGEAGAVPATVTPATASLALTAPEPGRGGAALRAPPVAALSLAAVQAVLSATAVRVASVAALPVTAPQAGWAADATRLATVYMLFFATESVVEVEPSGSANTVPASAAFTLTAPQAGWVADARVGVGLDFGCGIFFVTNDDGEPPTNFALAAADANTGQATAVLAATAPQAVPVGETGAYPATVTPAAAALGLTASQAGLSGDALVVIVEQEFNLAFWLIQGKWPTAHGDANASPAAAALTLIFPAAGTAYGTTVAATAAALALSADQSDVLIGDVASAPSAPLPLSAPQAVTSTGTAVTPASAALTLAAPQTGRAAAATVVATVAPILLAADQSTPALTGDATTLPAAAALILSAPQASWTANATRLATAYMLFFATESAVRTKPSGSANTVLASAAFMLSAPQAVTGANTIIHPAVAALILNTPQSGRVEPETVIACRVFISRAATTIAHIERSADTTVFIERAVTTKVER